MGKVGAPISPERDPGNGHAALRGRRHRPLHEVGSSVGMGLPAELQEGVCPAGRVLPALLLLGA